MRIDDLTVDGFGHFFEQQFGPFESPITVFCGPNEAGKTTLLAFIRAALFGFPRVGREKHYPALRGGQHGGGLRLRDDAGHRYELERRERTLSLRDESGGQLEQPDLDRLLGHASRDMFESVFAFGIGELQQLDLLDKGEAARHIYAAGMGAVRLPVALTSIDKARDELFKPGGKNPRISRKLRELELTDDAIRACEGDATRFATLRQDRHHLDALVEQARAAAADRAAARAEHELMQKAWPDWCELTERRARLAALPPAQAMPENALARLETVEAAIAKARDELTNADERVRRLEVKAQVELSDAQLLPFAHELAALTRRLDDAQHSVRDHGTRCGELRQAEAALAAALVELGPAWTASDVAAIDSSFPVRQAIREHDRQIKEASDAVREARLATAQAERTLTIAQANHEAATTRLAQLPPSPEAASLDARRSALREARTRLELAARAADRTITLEQASTAIPTAAPATTDSMRLRTPIGFALALVLAASGLVVGGALLLFAMAGAGVLALLVAGDAVRGRRPRARPPRAAPTGALAEARIAEAAAFAALAQSAATLDVDAISSQVLDGLEDALAQSARDSLVREQAVGRVADTLQELQRAQTARDEAAAALGERESAAQAAQATWDAWLATATFPDGLATAGAIDFLARVEAIKHQVDGASAIRQRIAKIEADIASFRALLTPLAVAANLPLEGDDTLVPAAEAITNRANLARRLATERDSLRRQLAEANEASHERQRRLAIDERALAELLQAARVENGDSYRLAARAAAERQALAARISDLELALSRLCGPAERVTALDMSLQGATAGEVEQALAAATEASRLATEQHQELRESRARLDTEIQHLDSGERASRLHAERAQLLEELRTLARSWATLTIAERLLERARDQYQQQRQPAVVAHAQEFFATVTGGRYQRIVPQIGKHALVVHTSDGRAVAPEDLSRGTREQLYLALRFGLIRQFNEQAARLPVIVDDILVNFDDERAMRTARAFVELARTNQVLVFTCHPSTAALFRAASKSTQVVDLAEIRKPQAPRLL